MPTTTTMANAKAANTEWVLCALLLLALAGSRSTEAKKEAVGGGHDVRCCELSSLTLTALCRAVASYASP
uniref:Putative secreted protein n=1 Tax=Anopheles darlingi TaxID=43151 RepID=A0A2M4DLC6_ANODA